MSKEVKLIECFRSFQGEGPDSGRTMYILRFKNCNLRCPWCDTQVKMRISAEAPYKIEYLQDLITRDRAGILVTGGEPTVPKHFEEALWLLNLLNYPIANVESNGFNLLELVQQTAGSKPVKFMYSPKIFTFTDLKQVIKTSEPLLDHHNVYFKIVFEDSDHIKAYCEWLHRSTEGRRAAERIWLMPEGVTRADLIRNSEKVFDACEKYKFNFSSRNHLIYGFV